MVTERNARDQREGKATMTRFRHGTSRGMAALALIGGFVCSSAAVLLVGGAPPAGAVTTSVDCGSGGNLATALAAATAGDTIQISGDCQGNFTVPTSLTLEQAPGAAPGFLDGHGSSGTVLAVDSGATVTLRSLTVENGNNANKESIAGIANGGNLTLEGSTVSNNNAADGYGGIENGGTLTLEDSTVSHNSGAFVGGIVGFGGTVTLEDSTVSNNSSNSGAGITNYATLTLEDSTVSGNTAAYAGGGGVFNGGTLNIEGSTIAANSAPAGTGANLDNGQGSVSVASSIFAEGGTGGDCLNVSSPPTTFTDLGYNLFDDNSCGSPASTSITPSSPGFDLALGSLLDNGGPTFTMEPGVGSSAIGQIPTSASAVVGGTTYSLCAGTDQRGAPRPGVGKTKCDIGAYETGDPQLAVTAPASPPLNFGSVAVNNSAGLPVDVVNDGNAPVTFSSIETTGSTAFAIAGTPDTSDLGVGASRDVTVDFAPTTVGVSTGDIEFYSNAPASPLDVGLTGTGVVSIPVVEQQLTNLQTSVAGFGPGRSLTDKLGLTLTYLNADDLTDACLTLNYFITEVTAQSGKTIKKAVASQLVASVNGIKAELVC